MGSTTIPHDAVTPPPRIVTRLRQDKRGYFVPWFVHWPEGGEPDFRVIGEGKIRDAYRFSLCWVCGGQRGRMGSFVIGPMCAVNRVSAELPCHRECAVYSAMVCPFLTRPKMRRNDKDLPREAYKEDGTINAAGGIGLARNPGVALVWTTREWEPESDGMGGTIFRLGDPEETLWFCQGRPATREEVLESIDSGLPVLRQLAEAEGAEAVAALEGMRERALVFLPAGA